MSTARTWLWALDMGFVAGESELADRVGQMQVEFGRSLLVDLAQEVQERLMAMLRTRARDHLAVGHIARGKQRHGAMMNIVVRDATAVINTMRTR